MTRRFWLATACALTLATGTACNRDTADDTAAGTGTATTTASELRVDEIRLGNAIGEGLVIDTSRHFNRILALDPEAMTATIEPGALPPGVTVDTQKIEDSTVAEMYISEDSAGGR